MKPRDQRPSKQDIKDKVNELLRLVQLENMAGRYPSQLSGGQRQRIALARALAIEPKVLLLDEPFGALDAQVRAELRRWLRKLHDTLHVTSIFVTHDQEEALEVADRIVVMNHGAIEQIGTPNEVFHRPATEFVMQFLGDVNVFHGRIESTPGKGPALPAKVYRVLTAGPIVKVELIDRHNRLIQVHLSHDNYNQTMLKLHEEVYLVPRESRVYANNDAWTGAYVI